MKQPLSTLPKLALAISAIAVAAPAISQSVLEEIVVVAQKREQNLQDANRHPSFYRRANGCPGSL